MSKYIRAELYRITRSKLFVVSAIIISIVYVAVTYLITGEWMVSREVLAQGSVMFSMAALFILTPIADHFRERTALYEIMDGTSPHIMIWYRIIIYISFILILLYLPAAGLLLIYDRSTDALLQLALMLCIYIRLGMFGICAALTGKNIESLLLLFARMIAESAVVALGAELGLWKAAVVASYLPYTQLSMLSSEIGTSFIMKITIGAAVEMILMYLLAYTSYKKKWAIKSVVQ